MTDFTTPGAIGSALPRQQATVQLIRAFLALPNEALPNANFADHDAECEASAAWDALRETARTGISLRVTSPEGAIRLQADRPEWRDGVVVF